MIAVPEEAPEAAPEVAVAADDALAAGEVVAWRARSAAGSWADAATSAGPRAKRGKARGLCFVPGKPYCKGWFSQQEYCRSPHFLTSNELRITQHR